MTPSCEPRFWVRRFAPGGQRARGVRAHDERQLGVRVACMNARQGIHGIGRTLALDLERACVDPLVAGKQHDLTINNFVNVNDGVASYLEPFVTCVIVTPAEFQGELVRIAVSQFRAQLVDTQALDDGKRSTLRLRMPLADSGAP